MEMDAFMKLKAPDVFHFSFFWAGLMERTRQAQCNEKLLIEGRVKENHAIIETYPSSHNHGSGKWVPPILVSFHLG